METSSTANEANEMAAAYIAAGLEPDKAILMAVQYHEFSLMVEQARNPFGFWLNLVAAGALSFVRKILGSKPT